MATYKVIQDIEAEDKILGPLTLRQFIYALIASALLYVCFICLSKGAPYLLVLFLPPALFAGFFAYPFGRDQPTEIWALAKIRFLFKPRRRIWNQSGVKELVTITVPKKIEVVRTNGLSPGEVQSRLKALANTIDSRGWVIKNVDASLYDQSGLTAAASSDRLISIEEMPRAVPDDVQPADMLDEDNNPVAEQFDHMINASEQNHRQALIKELNSPAPAPAAQPKQNDYWFLNQPNPPSNFPAAQALTSGARVVQPGGDDTAAPAGTATPDEVALAAALKAKNASNRQLYQAHLRTIQPLTGRPEPSASTDAAGPAATASSSDNNLPIKTSNGPKPGTATPSAPPYDPAILSLASNNDLDVATLAREAHKARNPDEPSPDEVVISLH